MDFAYDPQHLGADVQQLFARASEAFIVAPFITRRGLMPLIEALDPGRLDVVTRWELREIQAGVTDPSIIADVQATGGRVRLLPGLHAKLYGAGDHVLVGSANPTGPGLGFTNAANYEALVCVDRTHPAVERLIRIIDSTASWATTAYAEQLISHADALPKLPPPPAESDDTGSAPDWVPHSMVPSQLHAAYHGTSLTGRPDYVADFAALYLPPGLTADQFKDWVGLRLQQGLIGRIYTDCDGLQQHPAVERMRQLLADANVVIDEPPVRTWNRFKNWFMFFLDANHSVAGGFRSAAD